MMTELTNAIGQYGFPIVASFAMAYMVFYIWKWVTTEIKPVIGEANTTLIALVDRIRMLDNDMIRLNTKLSMVLEYHHKQGLELDDDVQEIIAKYASQSQQFNQNTNRNKSK